MDTVPQLCPVCGASLPDSAPGGLCPRCLLGGLLDPIHLNGAKEGTEELAGSKSQGFAPNAALSLGQIEDYELLEEIGHGGMGIIYKARQHSLDRVVALKLIRSGSQAKSADMLARFRTEATATARLRHPNIVAIHDVGEQNGQMFYTMEFVPGRSLAGELRAGPLPPKEAARLLLTISRAIDYAHREGVLHRDLKPANILLDIEGQPHVTDFGLAKFLQSDSDLTLSGAVIGSPQYMPPEQARGRSAEAGVRSDVYSLGAVLYEALTGRPPFNAPTPLETLKLVVEQEPIAPRALNPSLPPDLETICLKCLNKNQAQRYAAARALADDLERWQRGEPIHARPVKVRERVFKWIRRHPAATTFTALALLIPAIIIAILLVMGGKLTDQRNRALHQEQKANAEATRAEASELDARERAYAADIYAASQALATENLGLAHRLLSEYLPKGATNDEARNTNPTTLNSRLSTISAVSSGVCFGNAAAARKRSPSPTSTTRRSAFCSRPTGGLCFPAARTAFIFGTSLSAGPWACFPCRIRPL